MNKSPAELRQDPADLEDDQEFDWTGDHVVYGGAPGLAVYENPDGDIVVRNSDNYFQDDRFVVIARHKLGAFIERVDVFIDVPASDEEYAHGMMDALHRATAAPEPKEGTPEHLAWQATMDAIYSDILALHARFPARRK
jgi:hypothetical protein